MSALGLRFVLFSFRWHSAEFLVFAPVRLLGLFDQQYLFVVIDLAKLYLDDFGKAHIGSAGFLYSPATVRAIRRLARGPNFTRVRTRGRGCDGTWKELEE